MNTSKLKKIWAHKWAILEGLWYNHIVFFFSKKHWAWKQVQERRKLCAGCPFLDKEGSLASVVIKGKPACGLCGCNIKEKTASLSSGCTLGEVEYAHPSMKPLWGPIKIKGADEIEKEFNNDSL